MNIKSRPSNPSLSVFNSRLFWQYFFSYIGVMILTTFVISWYLHYRSSQLAMLEDLSRLKSQSLILRTVFIDYLDHQDRKQEIEKNLATIKASMNLDISLIDETGLILLDSKTPKRPRLEKPFALAELDQARRKDIGLDYRKTTDDRRKVYGAFQFAHNRKAYYIWIDQDSPSSVDSLIDIRIALTIGGGVSVLLSLILTFFLAKRITQPVAEIAHIANSIIEGHYDARPKHLPKNEIGELGQVILTLAKRVKANIKKREKTDKIRRNFSANISHELKTPLTSIKGYVETLLEGALKEPKTAENFLKIIGANVERLISLVNDMLRLATIEADETYVELTPVAWEEVVNDVLTRLKPVAAQKRIEVKTDWNKDIPMVLGEERAMNHITENLLQNAINYTDPGGEVTISQRLTDDGSKVAFSIKDTGIGIAKKNQSRVFERFYRVDKGRSRQTGGTGLGLAIVKHLVINIHGQIELESNPGEGAEFTILLPKAPRLFLSHKTIHSFENG